MIYVLFSLWIVSALLIIYEQRIVRIIVLFCIFSLISSVCYLLLGAPDVAMAEIAIGSFITVFFIICFEKYYGFVSGTPKTSSNTKRSASIRKSILPLCFAIFLFVLFIRFIPDTAANTYLKYQYISRFAHDVGGENSVTAIYLVYRVYDTLFEALMLLVSVMAVIHLSWHTETAVSHGKPSYLRNLDKAVFIIRIICPIILVFGVYLITHGHLSAGGGFQGGVLIATFFICRYMIHDIYDVPIGKFVRAEKMIFASITLIATLVIFLGLSAILPTAYLPMFQVAYLITMNILIGLKVACAFTILFYRYIAIERR